MSYDEAALREQIDLARLRVCLDFEHLSGGVYGLRGPIFVPGMCRQGGTMAVDYVWRLYVDPDWAAEQPVEVLADTIEHELWHCLLNHHERAVAVGVTALTRLRWNLAADFDVDSVMAKARARSWGCTVLTPKEVGLPDGLTAEEYYALLADKNIDKLLGRFLVLYLSGSCSGGGPQPWEQDSDTPGLPGVCPVEAQGLREAIAAATRDAYKSRGSMPAGLERWIVDTLSPPTVPWEVVLRGDVRHALSVAAGMTDYSRHRVSRRQTTSKILLPVFCRPVPKVVVAIDTSGSMTEEDLRMALSEAQGVLRSLGADVSFLSVDAEVHGGVQQLRDARAVQLHGGGGTDMGIGIEAAVRLHPDVLVVFTDGYTPWPFERPLIPTIIVALVGANCAHRETVPLWAKVVRVERAEGSRNT